MIVYVIYFQFSIDLLKSVNMFTARFGNAMLLMIVSQNMFIIVRFGNAMTVLRWMNSHQHVCNCDATSIKNNCE